MNNELPGIRTPGEAQCHTSRQSATGALDPATRPQLPPKTSSHEKFRYQTREIAFPRYLAVENKGPALRKTPNFSGSILPILGFGGPFLGFGNPKIDPTKPENPTHGR